MRCSMAGYCMALMTEFLVDGPEDATRTFVFAHGAGAPMNVPFMNSIARGIAAEGIRVVRFEFPYMVARRRVPDRQPVLLDAWRDVIRKLGAPERMVIGGKSLGGRMASMVADEMRVAGLICYGYPFHPPGKLDRPRTEHLRTLATPTLIVQGTRDPFGTPEDVSTYELSSSIEIQWIHGGDHSYKPNQRVNLETAIRLGVMFITSH